MEYAILTLENELDSVLDDMQWTFNDDEENKELGENSEELKKQ